MGNGGGDTGKTSFLDRMQVDGPVKRPDKRHALPPVSLSLSVRLFVCLSVHFSLCLPLFAKPATCRRSNTTLTLRYSVGKLRYGVMSWAGNERHVQKVRRRHASHLARPLLAYSSSYVSTPYSVLRPYLVQSREKRGAAVAAVTWWKWRWLGGRMCCSVFSCMCNAMHIAAQLRLDWTDWPGNLACLAWLPVVVCLSYAAPHAGKSDRCTLPLPDWARSQLVQQPSGRAPTPTTSSWASPSCLSSWNTPIGLVSPRPT